MADAKQLDDGVLICGQPTLIQIIRLANLGVRSVLNLREVGERGMRLTPAQEGAKIREFGLVYSHCPVAAGAINDAAVTRFERAFAALPRPCLVHDGDGQRATALALVSLGAARGWYAEDALERAEAADLELHSPALVALVRGKLAARPVSDEDEDEHADDAELAARNAAAAGTTAAAAASSSVGAISASF